MTKSQISMAHGREKTCRMLLFSALLCFFLVVLWMGPGTLRIVQAEGMDAHPDDPIIIGLLPYIDSRRLIAQYAPLVNFIQQRIAVQVRLISAPDFPRFLKRSLAGKYDIYLTAPHFAAQNIQKGDLLLLKFNSLLSGEIYVQKTSAYRTISDLKGMVMATPPASAIISLLAKEYLAQSDLIPEKDIQLLPTPGHDNALRSVIDGRAAAAIAAQGVYENFSMNDKEQLRIIARTRKIPHAVLMMSHTINIHRQQQLRMILESFVHSRGNSLLAMQTGFNKFIPINNEDRDRILSLLSLTQVYKKP